VALFGAVAAALAVDSRRWIYHPEYHGGPACERLRILNHLVAIESRARSLGISYKLIDGFQHRVNIGHIAHHPRRRRVQVAA
jgi:hypothetical protein